MSGETLLKYSLGTSPNLLQAARLGTLNFVAANPDPVNPITCYAIYISISIGPKAADLTFDSGTIQTPQPVNWIARFEGPVYSAKPCSGSTTLTDAVLLTLEAVLVNDQIGVTNIFIDEEASDGFNPRALRTTQLDLAKFPTEFTLSDLTVTPDTIESGGSAVLMWTGTNLPGLVTYKLSWVAGGKPKEAVVPWIGPWTVDGIDTEPNTFFTLQANVAGLPEPVKRPGWVNVIPHLPVIDSFTGEIEGRQVRLRWSARHAESCFIDSVQYAATGHDVLPLDRICYVLTARNKTRNIKATLALRFTKTISRVQRSAPLHLLVSSDASSLVAVMNDFGCVLLDGSSLAERKVLVERMPGDSGVAVAAISSDRRYIFAAYSGIRSRTATMFNDREQPIRTLDAGRIVAAAFSPASEWLYAVTDDGARFTLHQFTAATFEKVAEMAFDGSVSPPASMCTSPSGDRVFVFGGSWIYVIDVSRHIVTGTGGSGGRTQLSSACWRTGDDLRLASGAHDVGIVFDGRTLQYIAHDIKWGRFILSETELIARLWSEDGLPVVDRNTLSPLVTLPIPTGSPSKYPGPIAFAAGVLYVADALENPARFEIKRYAATSVVPVAQSLSVDVLTGEETLVAVAAAAEAVTLTVEGEHVVAEPPPGWSVTREDQNFTFTPDEGVAEGKTVAFTFRGVAGDRGVGIVPGGGSR